MTFYHEFSLRLHVHFYLSASKITTVTNCAKVVLVAFAWVFTVKSRVPRPLVYAGKQSVYLSVCLTLLADLLLLWRNKNTINR